MDQHALLDGTFPAKELPREVYEADEQGNGGGDHESGAGGEGIHVEGECERSGDEAILRLLSDQIDEHVKEGLLYVSSRAFLRPTAK